ncbi:MAG: late competence development ComFB family protein [Clostridiales bacterium]|nr:late competence development ComFB family protein [Clostridiales bacterium]
MDDTQNNETAREELILVNVVESLVRVKTREMIKTFDMCQCDQCYFDACAIALNHTKPLYITTHKGQLLSKLTTINYGYQAVQMVEIMKALEKVKGNPKHK